MRRAVIVGGAGIGNYQRIRAELQEDDYFIFCDSGLRHRDALGVRPSLIVGDFDSHPVPELYEGRRDTNQGEEMSVRSESAAYGKEILYTYAADGTELIILPHMKDWTDTVFAAKEAASRCFENILLIGVSGGRPDHYFANITILNLPEIRGLEAWILDDCSKMRLLTNGCSMRIDDSVQYFSLLPFNGPARGVTVRGALYPLENAEVTAEDPYAVSNEVLPGKTAEISLTEGCLLVVLIL